MIIIKNSVVLGRSHEEEENDKTLEMYKRKEVMYICHPVVPNLYL